jgi:hypothetical protein
MGKMTIRRYLSSVAVSLYCSQRTLTDCQRSSSFTVLALAAGGDGDRWGGGGDADDGDGWGIRDDGGVRGGGETWGDGMSMLI